MVLQRDWCTERRHDAVARELAQRAAVALHDGCGAVQQIDYDLAQQPFCTDGRCDFREFATEAGIPGTPAPLSTACV